MNCVSPCYRAPLPILSCSLPFPCNAILKSISKLLSTHIQPITAYCSHRTTPTNRHPNFKLLSSQTINRRLYKNGDVKCSTENYQTKYLALGTCIKESSLIIQANGEIVHHFCRDQLTRFSTVQLFFPT